MGNLSILFVNDEADDGLSPQNIQKIIPADWTSHTANTGQDALSSIPESNYDVIIAKSTLPDVNGANLLEQANELSPKSIRFLLVDREIDRAMIRKSWSYIHQYISWPCPPEALVSVLQDSLKLRSILQDDNLRSRMTAIGALPSPPELHTKIMAELDDDNSSAKKIAELISQDVSISARILATANSAFFGLKRRVDDVGQAINALGIDLVESLVFAAGVYEGFDASAVNGYSINSIHDRGVAVGAKARLLAHVFGMNNILSNDAMLAGTLHNVGKLVMLSYFRDEFQQAIDLSKKDSIPLYEAQQKIVGATDCAIGAYLLSLWGLHDSIIQAVAWHYTPSIATAPAMTPLTAVHLAYALDHDERKRVIKNQGTAIDLSYLSTLGLDKQLDGIRGVCTGAVATA